MHSATAHYPLTSPPLSSDPAPIQLPQFIYWAWRHMVWNMPLASLDQLAWLYSLPDSAGTAREAEKSLTSNNHYLATTKKHQCIINIILILNPKHSTIPATRKKINCIPAKTRTFCQKDIRDS